MSFVTDLIGSSMQADAAQSAADTQSEAAKYAADKQYEMYKQNREDLTPFRQTGKAAADRLYYALGLPMGDAAAQAAAYKNPGYNSLGRTFRMSDYQADPGYAFRIAEGQKALERSAAARGGLLSGAQGKAMTRYGQDMGSQEFAAARGRFVDDQTNTFNKLSTLMGGGQTAASNTASLGQTAANNAANYTTSGAAAQAAGQVGAANAWSSGLGSVGNSINNAFGMPGTSQGSIFGSGWSSSPGRGWDANGVFRG